MAAKTEHYVAGSQSGNTVWFKRLRPSRRRPAVIAHDEPIANPIDYPPLCAEQRQMRLLTWNENEKEELECHLTTVSLNDTPEYTALSYVWGTQQPTHRVQVDGRPFWIRPNLYEFLKLTAREQNLGRGMFIDAVSINQDDMNERASQVALMGSVYRGATEVVAWFGDEGGWASDLATEFPAIREVAVLQSCLVTTTGTSMFSTENARNIRSAVWTSLAWHAYWSRVWIVQEYQLPSRLVLRAGPLSLTCTTYHGLCKAQLGAQYLEGLLERSHPAVSVSPLPLSFKMHNLHRSMNLVARRRDPRTQTDPASEGFLPLYRAVVAFSEQECLVARDHIFGILGLCRSTIIPDYNAPLLRLYTRTLMEGLIGLACANMDSADKATIAASFIAALSSSLGLRLRANTATMVVTLLALLQTHNSLAFYIFGESVHILHSRLRNANLGRLNTAFDRLLWRAASLETQCKISNFERVRHKCSRVLGPEVMALPLPALSAAALTEPFGVIEISPTIPAAVFVNQNLSFVDETTMLLIPISEVALAGTL
ncbi:hypothetical protein LTR56_006190 [Elasticomyces elasticus]|nr:hypothetical protein LTR56_006190 [Elasticomyces elasticus]KAK3666601.1 hypothetical protein LTR22_002545 [Elasticomyces elasticus]KAK4928266.1 hypothetical protein LTR49_004943 [Elasticomyces elasticus]KAK5763829.1 hypothetical protein LTS12_005947 [Elasticomyces elasticus]